MGQQESHFPEHQRVQHLGTSGQDNSHDNASTSDHFKEQTYQETRRDDQPRGMHAEHNLGAIGNSMSQPREQTAESMHRGQNSAQGGSDGLASQGHKFPRAFDSATGETERWEVSISHRDVSTASSSHGPSADGRGDADVLSSSLGGSNAGHEVLFGESSRQRHDEKLPFGEKTCELLEILTTLEGVLADASNLRSIGRAYRRLSDWSWTHQFDKGLDDMLKELECEAGYPAWRRQALEESYALFFDDVAQHVNSTEICELPEPPTSEATGFKPISHVLASSRASRSANVSGHFERGSRWLLQRRWDYDIKRNSSVFRAMPRSESGPRGREIIERGMQERYCVGAVDPVAVCLRKIFGTEACCVGARKTPKALTNKPSTISRPRKQQPSVNSLDHSAGVKNCL
eukprot:TRINITY_DN37253_c0_g1_i1.p1 TRINITY_DN37253_c0_g1~~TRINITY_DN37253_c0_g1_i1.p1  ORF type:complete len:403 (+),score=45.21 TRINITY_DN37253_c0_g1_i1:130-1338(+)